MATHWDLVKTHKGQTKVVMTDVLAKVRAKKKQLEDSQRGLKVRYEICESKSEEKKRFKPHSQAWRAGGYGYRPSVIKKGKGRLC